MIFIFLDIFWQSRVRITPKRFQAAFGWASCGRRVPKLPKGTGQPENPKSPRQQIRKQRLTLPQCFHLFVNRI